MTFFRKEYAVHIYLLLCVHDKIKEAYEDLADFLNAGKTAGFVGENI